MKTRINDNKIDSKIKSNLADIIPVICDDMFEYFDENGRVCSLNEYMFSLLSEQYDDCDEKLFKEKNKLIKFIVFIFVGYFFVINIEVVCGIIQSILFHIFNLEVATSDNQQKLESIIHAAPYFMVISTCLFAALEEELLFRGSIRRTIKNKGVFIAVSGLFFGLLHITDNYILLVLLLLECFALSEIIESKAKTANKVVLSVISVAIFVSIFIGTIIVVHGNLYNYFYSIDPKEIINGITYVTLGCYFASIYAFTNNIYYTIGIHIVTNTIATILLLTL